MKYRATAHATFLTPIADTTNGKTCKGFYLVLGISASTTLLAASVMDARIRELNKREEGLSGEIDSLEIIPYGTIEWIKDDLEIEETNTPIFFDSGRLIYPSEIISHRIWWKDWGLRSHEPHNYNDSEIG